MKDIFNSPIDKENYSCFTPDDSLNVLDAMVMFKPTDILDQGKVAMDE